LGEAENFALTEMGFHLMDLARELIQFEGLFFFGGFAYVSTEQKLWNLSG
jgi:hypothetical protein